MKDRTNEESPGTLLDDLPKKKQKSGWAYHPLYAELSVIKDWGRLPSEFGLCPPEDDLNFMAAYTRITNKMLAYDDYRQEQKMERQRKANRAKGKA